jgi:hypothetical protein
MAEWIYARGNSLNRRIIRQFLALPPEEDVVARAKADFRQILSLHARWDAIDRSEGGRRRQIEGKEDEEEKGEEDDKERGITMMNAPKMVGWKNV